MRYLFLDTNIYLHYNDYEQIKWKDYISNLGDFSIVVPGIVRSEINKHKDNGNPKIKNRAIRVISRLKDIVLYGKKSIIPLLSYGYPPVSLYDGVTYDKDCKDDTLILSILDFKSQHPTEQIILVAADFDILVKAYENNIEYLELPESEKLPNEVSKEEKKIKELEKEVALYKNRVPKIEVGFKDNDKLLLSLNRPILIDLDELAEAKLYEEKEKHPFLKEVQEDDVTIYYNQLLGNIQNSNIRSYNAELEKYFNEYKNYIKNKEEGYIIYSYLKKIEIRIVNKGTCDTGKIYCLFKFPNDIDLYGDENIIFKKVKTPTLPSKSYINLALDQHHLNQMMTAAKGEQFENIPSWNLIKPLSEKEYEFKHDGIGHSLPPLDIDFEKDLYIDTRTCKNFKIEYKIVATNLPKPIEGNLNVRFENS